MKKLLAIAALAAASTVQANVEEKAAACVACHGVGGVSTIPANPTLAGQHRTYLVQALNDYKNGSRKNPIMKGMVAGLSEDDIEELASYFANQSGGLK